MYQKLYTIKIFYLDQYKHYSVWHNCNTSGINRLKKNNPYKIAYIELYKPKTNSSKPLETIYFTDVFAVTFFYSDGRVPKKEYNILNLNWCEINAKNDGAIGMNIYNISEKKFFKTIKF